MTASTSAYKNSHQDLAGLIRAWMVIVQAALDRQMSRHANREQKSINIERQKRNNEEKLLNGPTQILRKRVRDQA